MEEAAAHGKRIIWGAPVHDQVRVGFEEAKRAVGGYATFNYTHLEVKFPSGGIIRFRSLDNPDNVRGHSADGIVIDECADVNPLAYHQVLRPMLIDTKGWVWLIGTPVGRNWFYSEWKKFSELPDGAAWQAPTMGCKIVNGKLVRDPHPLENGDLDFNEIISEYKSKPEELFRQELMAEFLQNEGSVFKNVLPCLLEGGEVDPLVHAGHHIVMGVDWGQKKDYTAVCCFCVTCMEEVELRRFNRMQWEFLRSRVTALWRKWRAKSIVCEMNAIGDPNYRELDREGLPVRPFNTNSISKPKLIQSLVLALEKEDAFFLDYPFATEELLAYASKYHPQTGRMTYFAPAGMHDDTVIARGLALHGALTPNIIYID